MAITPRQMLCPEVNRSWKFPYAMTPEFIVVHNTANDASAHNEITYMNRTKAQGGAQVSYHFAIDDKEVVQGLPLNVNGWHAGDGASGKGNRKGIAIEICYSKSGGDRFIKAEKLAAEFIAQLLKERGWGLDKVTKHQDYSNKYCPHRTLDMGWQRFLDMIDGYLNPAKPVTPAPTTTTFKVGDVVQFNGGKHYTSANGNVGYTVKAGPAKITAISNGAKHQYHVVHTDSTSSVYGWVDASSVAAQKVDVVTPAPTPAPTPTPTPTPAKKEIAVGDIVNFKGSKHYTSANGATGYGVKAGPAKVTRISKDAKHPYHLVHTDSQSNVYGWVDANDIAEYVKPAEPVVKDTTIRVGDAVMFNGGKNYSSANGLIGWTKKAGKATITNIKTGAKHPYHAVRVSGGTSDVYGWVDANTVSKI